jgi:hypothetical protein
VVDKGARNKMMDMVELEVEWATWAQETAERKAEEKKKREAQKEKDTEEAEMEGLLDDEE